MVYSINVSYLNSSWTVNVFRIDDFIKKLQNDKNNNVFNHFESRNLYFFGAIIFTTKMVMVLLLSIEILMSDIFFNFNLIFWHS